MVIEDTINISDYPLTYSSSHMFISGLVKTELHTVDFIKNVQPHRVVLPQRNGTQMFEATHVI